MLNTWITFFKAHERFLLVGIVLATGAWGYTRWLDKSATDAKLNAAVAAQVAQQADASKKQADAAQAQLIAQTNAQLTLLSSQIASDKQTIASLVQTIASRDAASSRKTNEVNQATTPLQVAQDFGSAYGLDMSGTPITADSRLSLTTEEVKTATVAKIEGDTAKADLKDTRTELDVAHGEIGDLETVIVAKDKVITQDVITLQAHDTAAAADLKKVNEDLKEVKAVARRSKWRTFWVGFAAGFIGRQVMKSYTGM